MPCSLQWCVVVPKVEFIGPESSFKRETGSKALVFLPLHFFLFDGFVLLVPVLNLFCALHCFHCFLFCQLPFMGVPYLRDVLPICSASCMFCFVLQAFVTWMPPEIKMCATRHLFVPLVVTLVTYLMQNAYTLRLTRLSQS